MNQISNGSWRRALPPVLVFAAAFWANALLESQGIDLRDEGWWLLGSGHASGIHEQLHLEEASGRFALLRAVQTFAGNSASSLVWLEALLSALVASLLFSLLQRAHARASAWLGAALVVVLGPPAPWLLPALMMALALRRESPAMMASAVALAPAFGAGSALICGVTGLAGWRRIGRRALLAGCSAGAALWLVLALYSGGIGDEWRAGWSRPALRVLASLGDGGAWSWWNSARGGPLLALPFAEVQTGERLEALFSAHGALRAMSYRLLYGAVWLTLALGLWRALRARRFDLPVSLAVSAALCILVRGDLIQLRVALLLALPALLLMAERIPLSRWMALACALPLLMPGAERAWLLSHHYRQSLVLWDGPRAELLLSRSAVQEFQALETQLEEGPVLAWPNAPGLHWLLDRAPATRFVRQPSADVSEAMLQEMDTTPPAALLLAPECARGPRSLAVLQPALLERLRAEYQLLGSTSVLGQSFRLLSARPDDVSIDELSLSQLLPAAEMGVGTDTAPVLRKGLAVGQSFRMGETDIRGFSMRWNSSRDGVILPLRFHIWEREGDNYDTLLHFFDAEVEIEESGMRNYLRVGPLPGTAGRELAISYNLREEVDFEARPLWHRHDEGGADFYPLGTAMINDEPVAADLYFAIY